MTLPDVRNEWTVGYIVNLQGQRRGRWRGDRRTSYAPPLVETKECRERLTLDERVVALDPAVRGEDEEVEPDSERLAVLVDRLPVELDDVAESLGVVAPPEAEPLGADPVLVRARGPSLSSYPCASASPVGHSSAPRAARSRKPREPGAGP
jgi:hypothetical protein